jgi:hypothetical protein
MYLLSNRKGYSGYGEIQWEDGDSEAITSNIPDNKILINEANLIELSKIFKFYNINIDNRKCVCPFLNHKGGRESSPSFYFYPDTNSFYCFGCKIGTLPVDFVSNIENIGRIKAATKIIELFGSEQIQSVVNINNNFQLEKNQLLIDFSFFIHEKIIYYKNNKEAIDKIEDTIYVFDKLNNKYDLDVKALKSTISKIKDRIDQILCQF